MQGFAKCLAIGGKYQALGLTRGRVLQNLRDFLPVQLRHDANTCLEASIAQMKTSLLSISQQLIWNAPWILPTADDLCLFCLAPR